MCGFLLPQEGRGRPLNAKRDSETAARERENQGA